MPKILTFTANTALDTVLTLEPFSLGDNVQAQNCQVYAAGKGVNVAKALASLEQPVIAQGFVGQASRHWFDALASAYCRPQFIEVKGATRSNLTLSCPKSGQETHIRTPGYQLSPQICDEGLRQLCRQIQAGDLVVLSGSLPLGAPTDYYQQLTAQCQRQGARVIVDSSGPALAAAIVAKPFLLKPNHEELAALVNQPLNDVHALVAAAQSLITAGIECVVVSRAEQGALLVTHQQVFCADYSGESINTISSIGCGDALVAGLAAAILRGDAWQDILIQGVACGTANLFNAEPGKISASVVSALRSQVKVCAWLKD